MIVDAVDDFITRETYNVRRGKCKHGAQRRRCHSVRGVLYMMHGVIEGNVIVTLDGGPYRVWFISVSVDLLLVSHCIFA
jgi:hypothetical protein